MPAQQNISDLEKILDTQTKDLGFSGWGITSLKEPLTISKYKEWLDKNYHAEMKYLETHLPIKADPRGHFQFMQTALVFSFPYFPVISDSSTFPLKHLRVASYAQRTDYHYWIKEKLQAMIQSLQKLHPEHTFMAAVDSSPILERDLAARAGLGWFGKNTCLIHPKKGSLFFISEILTSLKIEPVTAAVPDFCGNCTKCIDICPTKALEEPRVLNANKCISYWTIESRRIPPLELRPQMGDWFFGCDLCQTVCPWNEKVFKGQLNTSQMLECSEEQTTALIEELRLILTLSGKKLSKLFALTPLDRAGSFGLRRNALIVIGNRKLYQLKDEVAALIKPAASASTPHSPRSQDSSAPLNSGAALGLALEKSSLEKSSKDLELAALAEWTLMQLSKAE
jgi:epoxyqueuosine reductase